MPMDTETYEALGLHLPLTPLPRKSKAGPWGVPEGDRQYNPVSYTHLTLPTILLV